MGKLYSRFDMIRIKWLSSYFFLQLILAPAAGIAFYFMAKEGSASYFGIISFIIYSYFLYKLISEPRLIFNSRNNNSYPGIRKDNDSTQMSISEKEKLSHLYSIMSTEKLFLSKEITLADIAFRLNVSPVNLQNILVSNEGRTFNDLINGFRLEHSKLLLTSDEFKKYKIDTIADLCGFSSRTTFYELFKKEFNLTPLQFRKGYKSIT